MVGVLKAKVGGVWVPVSAQGQPGPPGPAVTGAYCWAGYTDAVSIPANVDTLVPVSSIIRASGFTKVGGVIQCNVAGTYLVNAVATLEGSYADQTQYQILKVAAYRSTTLLNDVQVVGGKYTYWNTQAVTGIFDLQVNDELRLYHSMTVAGASDWRTFLSVTSIGTQGPIGPQGIPGSLGPDTGWVALTLGSGWTNYGGSYGTPRVRRIANVTYVEGLVTGAAGNVNQIITTLPVGFRPGQDLIILQHASNSTNGVTRMDFQAGGGITCGGTVQNYLSIVNSFPADQ